MCIAGVFFGICALLFIEILHFFEWLRKRLSWSDFPTALLGGTTLAALAWLFSERYLGLGLDTIHFTLEGGAAPR